MFKKLKVFLMGCFVAAACSPAFAALDIVSLDETSGDVTFDPSIIATPIISVVITTITTMAVLTLIIVGVRWIMRIIRGR